MLGMSMGKTRICIDANRTIPYPMFVLAPKFAALDTWGKEIQKWDEDRKFVVLHGKDKEFLWAESDEYTTIIMNYDGLPWFYKIVQQQLRPLQKYHFVFDEASMLKAHNTNRALILNNMTPIMSPYKTALSGTPAPQSLVDLWHQYYLLDGGKALTPEFYQFRNRYFDFDPKTYSTTIKDGAAKHIYDAIAPITIRLKAEDYLDLPEVMINDIKLKLPYKLRRMYEKFEEEFILEFPTAASVAVSSAALESKLRQFLQGAVYTEQLTGPRRRGVQQIHTIKAQVLKEIVATSAGQPILAATQFKFEREIYEKVLGKKIATIDGSTSGSRGKMLIDRWNKGLIPLLLVHPKSVAYSLNLQEGGHRILFLGLPWELDLYQQLIARLVRVGQRSNRVIVDRLIFKNTKDEKVAAYLRRKDATQEGLFNAMVAK